MEIILCHLTLLTITWLLIVAPDSQRWDIVVEILSQQVLHLRFQQSTPLCRRQQPRPVPPPRTRRRGEDEETLVGQEF